MVFNVKYEIDLDDNSPTLGSRDIDSWKTDDQFLFLTLDFCIFVCQKKSFDNRMSRTRHLGYTSLFLNVTLLIMESSHTPPLSDEHPTISPVRY